MSKGVDLINVFDYFQKVMSKTTKPIMATFTKEPISLTDVRKHQYVTKREKTPNGHRAWLLFGKKEGCLVFRKTKYDRMIGYKSDGTVKIEFEKALAEGFATFDDIEQALELK